MPYENSYIFWFDFEKYFVVLTKNNLLQRLCQDIISAAKKAAALLFTALIGCGCAQQHNRGRGAGLHGGAGLPHGAAGGRDHMIYAVKTSPPMTPVAICVPPSPAAASPASVTSSASSGAAGNNSKEPPPIDPADPLPIKSFSFAQKCIVDQDNRQDMGQTYLRNHNTVYNFALVFIIFYIYIIIHNLHSNYLVE